MDGRRNRSSGALMEPCSSVHSSTANYPGTTQCSSMLKGGRLLRSNSHFSHNCAVKIFNREVTGTTP